MHLASFLAFSMPTHSGTEHLQIALRWIHLLAGITWIGLLYFFNLVNVPFMKQVDAGMKPKIFEHLTLPALWWFRWSALVTVGAGFWYWAQVYVAADAERAGQSPWPTIGFFLLIWIAAWAVIALLVNRAPAVKALNNGWVLAVLIAVLVTAASWLFVTYTPVGGDDNHVLSIGVGGGMGIIMLLNVWGIIWRNNKKIIQGALSGNPPADAAALARQAFLASRANFFLSVPMLFFMAASYHFVILGK